MKTKNELNKLKDEYQSLTNKLKELSSEELEIVTGGNHCPIYEGPGNMIHEPTYGETVTTGEIKPSSTEAWFGNNDNNKN